MEADLKQREAHFEFGANWLSYLDHLSEARIAEAVRGMQRLFPDGQLQGKRFLDIGCGSGLSMLAALKLGANQVVGVDIDENSVEASTRCLSRFAPEKTWRVSRVSVFDLNSKEHGRYDVVHSWGVLHHTGDLWRAVETASALVSKQGLFALALYRKTTFCRFWRTEKYIYSRAPVWVQAPARWLYQLAWVIGQLSLRRNPISRIRGHFRNRGMSWTHDVHDWLGGYPYESTTPDETRAQLNRLGFEVVREWAPTQRFFGVFGSGCNEYVARREQREH